MKKALLVSVLMGFGLFGCINDNSPGERTEATGVARIKLPQLPAGYADSGVVSAYSLTVTVTGPGMQPLSRAWMLSEFGGQTVSFEDIPAGPNRIFTGVLMRGATKTHAGGYTLDIGGGETVMVPLVLRDVRTGRAEICVEVEGWPGSPDCMAIDTLPADTSVLAGCWHIQAYDGSTLVSGKLSLSSHYDGLYGTFKFDDGYVVWANASIADGAWRITLHPIVLRRDTPSILINDSAERQIPYTERLIDSAPDTSGNRSYQFRIDSFSFGPADQPNGSFWGAMMDPSFRKVVGKVTGTANQCLIAVEMNDTFKTDRAPVIGAPVPAPYYPPRDPAPMAH